MNQSFVKLKDELALNKKEFLLTYERALGIKIKDVEFIENNEIFNKMISAYKDFDNFMNVATELNMTVEHKDFITVIEKKKGAVIKFQDTITFFFNDGSHIRFSAFNKNGIEISRVWVRPDNHRRGFGSLLMDLLFEFIDFVEVEPSEYFLECTGAVGTDDNHQAIGVDIQTKFFRKFGFRVANGKGYPNYVTMLKSAS